MIHAYAPLVQAPLVQAPLVQAPLVQATVRADSQTPLIAEGLDRHRERDHLTQEIVQLNHRPPIQPCLEILSEADTVPSQAPLPLWVGGLMSLRRTQDQSIAVAKFMRIALGTAAALETDPTGDFSLDQHVVSHPCGGQREAEGRFDLPQRFLGDRLPIRPPFPARLEFVASRLLRQPLDLDLEVGHVQTFPGARPGGRRNRSLKKNKVFWIRSLADGPGRAGGIAQPARRRQDEVPIHPGERSDLRYAPRPMATIRTRFAPSPTGFLHIGGARTALFNWALTRRLGGEFVLRIEDTDHERSTRESEQAVLDGLRWLGIEWDEGPHRQTERAGRHAEVVEELLSSGAAYRCACTKDDLEDRRAADIAAGGKGIYDGRCRKLSLGPDCGPHVVRLRVDPDARLRWNDLVFGPSGQDASEIGDGVIRRSDGSPLYHLAVVVDDLDMRITHVVRGADHHSNTPFQLALYHALGATPPIFAHLPLIVAESGRKLSKRKDPVSLQQFKADGYLPEAMLNWLARLGWSHGDQEIFSAAEIIEFFDLEHVGRSGAQADLAKLDFLCQHYLKERTSDSLFEAVSPFLDDVAGRSVPRDASLDRLLDLLRERSTQLVEMAEKARFVLIDKIEIDPGAAKKHLRPVVLEPLEALVSALEALGEWTIESLEGAFEETCRAQGDLKLGKLAQPVRVAVTGTGASPGIYETLEVAGRDRTLDRLRKALEFIHARAAGS